MRDLWRSRPSPAMLVAMLALVVALGGTAIAAINLGKGDVKRKHLAKNAVTAKKIKDGAVKGAKLGPDVRAFARVDDDGDLVGQSKGVNGIDAGSEDWVFCFDLAFKPHVVVASADNEFASLNEAGILTQVGSVDGCPSSTDAVVYTVTTDGGGGQSAGFSVLFN